MNKEQFRPSKYFHPAQDLQTRVGVGTAVCVGSTDTFLHHTHTHATTWASEMKPNSRLKGVLQDNKRYPTAIGVMHLFLVPLYLEACGGTVLMWRQRLRPNTPQI